MINIATTQKQMPKPEGTKQKAPRKELSDKEKRERFAKRANGVLKSLSRAARVSESIMRKPEGSDAQIEAFRASVKKLTERATRAANGEAAQNADLVPSE